MKMETFLQKPLGLKSHRIPGVEETDMELLVHIERIDRRALICSGCSRPVRATRGQNRKRRWRDLPLRDRTLILVYAPFRLDCPRCGIVQEKVPWAGEKNAHYLQPRQGRRALGSEDELSGGGRVSGVAMAPRRQGREVGRRVGLCAQEEAPPPRPGSGRGQPQKGASVFDRGL